MFQLQYQFYIISKGGAKIPSKERNDCDLEEEFGQMELNCFLRLLFLCYSNNIIVSLNNLKD